MNVAILEKYIPKAVRDTGIYQGVSNYIQSYVGMKEDLKDKNAA